MTTDEKEPQIGDLDNPDTLWPALSPDALCWFDFTGRLPCTRFKGHEGKHAFGNGNRIVEVWE